jgi:hypothetical protein
MSGPGVISKRHKDAGFFGPAAAQMIAERVDECFAVARWWLQIIGRCSAGAGSCGDPEEGPGGLATRHQPVSQALRPPGMGPHALADRVTRPA